LRLANDPTPNLNEFREPLPNMFGGFAPPQQSEEEIRALEAEAAFTVQQVAATAVFLYLSPFAIDMIGKIF